MLHAEPILAFANSPFAQENNLLSQTLRINHHSPFFERDPHDKKLAVKSQKSRSGTSQNV